MLIKKSVISLVIGLNMAFSLCGWGGINEIGEISIENGRVTDTIGQSLKLSPSQEAWIINFNTNFIHSFKPGQGQTIGLEIRIGSQVTEAGYGLVKNIKISLSKNSKSYLALQYLVQTAKESGISVIKNLL